MNLSNNCRTKQGSKQQTDFSTTQFIRTVLEQQRHANELQQQEIQSTAENPRIRLQNETTDISAELKALRRDEFVRGKRRQQLRNNNHELRQLEHQLQIAVTAKNLAEQLNLAEENKKEVELNKRKENEEAENERLRNLEMQRQVEENERLKRSQLRANLLEQINGMKEKRKDDYAQVMRERDGMQQMLRQFDVERENERKEVERRKKETYNMMTTFLRESSEYKDEMKLKYRSDESLVMKVLEEREQQRQRGFEQRRKQWDDHAELSKRVGLKVFQTLEEKQKRENLLLDLLVEERNANEEIRYRRELEKREEERTQMRGELERYLGEVKYYKAHTQIEEAESWQVERKKLDAQQVKEREAKEEATRKRMLEHQQGILQLIDERRVLRAMSAAEERNLYQQLIKEQMDQDEEVQKERLRLLKNCSSDVLRYLPTGVLKETDKEQFALATRQVANHKSE